jgi:hypothetical protein
MKLLPLKTTSSLIAILVGCILQPIELSASDAIMPYLEAGKSDKSGQFSYAIYNDQWLSHDLNPGDEKQLKRVAILGVLPGAKGKIVIPSLIEGHEVYGIDENAFKSSTGVTGIVIPKTVRFLKPGTLNRCQGLESIEVAADHPDFTSIDGVMFDKQKTKLLALGSGRTGRYEVPATTKEIGPYALSFCINLKSIVIPKGVTDIGGRRGSVFLGCSKLESIDIADTVTNIGQKSFQDCSSLKQITVPPTVTAIPFGLFLKCSSLTTITLPDGITKIGNYAFADCSLLTLKQFPKSLTTIGSYAFKNCKALKGITVPKSVTKIAKGAFLGCDVGKAY